MRFYSICISCGRRFADQKASNHKDQDGRCLSDPQLLAVGTVRNIYGIYEKQARS